eukprot:4501917-Pyramimonas_sp.AAC.1
MPHMARAQASLLRPPPRGLSGGTLDEGAAGHTNKHTHATIPATQPNSNVYEHIWKHSSLDARSDLTGSETLRSIVG